MLIRKIILFLLVIFLSCPLFSSEDLKTVGQDNKISTFIYNPTKKTTAFLLLFLKNDAKIFWKLSKFGVKVGSPLSVVLWFYRQELLHLWSSARIETANHSLGTLKKSVSRIDGNVGDLKEDTSDIKTQLGAVHQKLDLLLEAISEREKLSPVLLERIQRLFRL